MLTVACVLKSGGEYLPEHVIALRDGVERHLPDAAFVCLSDIDVPGVTRKPLLCDWPGWWSKMEAFCPGTFAAPVLYLDLDSVVVGDLSDIAAYRGPFAMLRDFYRPERGQSAVMAWTPGTHTDEMYRRFAGRASDHMARLRGDQDFINECLPEADRLQDHAPGQIVSYKRDIRDAGLNAPPNGARLVAFHGVPRPWEVERDW